MAIPEAQIATWTNPGATVTAKATHESIRLALSRTGSPLADLISSGSVVVRLQGSYKNDTNTRGDSDVDVLVRLDDTFGHNAPSLPEDQRNLHVAQHNPATYRWDQFRADVEKALSSYYGATNIDAKGNKSIKVLPASGRLRADVVPAISFRKYSYYYGPSAYSADEGIKFYHRVKGHEIINFPDHFYNNGVDKNSATRTNGNFKPIVRAFKNARACLVEKNILANDVAPSYFLQSLVYNAPDNLFVDNHQTAFRNVLAYLYQNSIGEFMSQNGIDKLFGTTGEQWTTANAVLTINALVKLWDEWDNI